jgi:hypothetical protein
MMVTELAASLMVCSYLAAELILVLSSESRESTIESGTACARRFGPEPRSSRPVRQMAGTLVMRNPRVRGRSSPGSSIGANAGWLESSGVGGGWKGVFALLDQQLRNGG